MLLHQFMSHETRSELVRSVQMRAYRDRVQQNLDSGNGLELLLHLATRRFTTVVVESERSRPSAALTAYVNSCLFQFAYNANLSLVPVRSLGGLFSAARLANSRRARMNEIQAPRRVYNGDLLHHYLAALASEDPAAQYLNYYHIAEHYFDAVFDDRVLHLVRDRLALPSFSLRRDDDLRGLVKLIQREVRELKEEHVSFDERLALQLTLEKYVSFQALIEEVRRYDENLFTYYASNKVSFADAGTVDLLAATGGPALAESLSRRVYKTRNAIVHAKGGERKRYRPYVHEDLLRKELPLARFLAEQVMLGSSRLLD
ncbi:hypothetical protein [Blastococcus montanus]|uniref:hypothetical protein n=1 Tax=Blastococcus montanus TaxID=3144973 RepID=UPI00320B1329